MRRLAPVLKTIFHQCVMSCTCSQSYSDGSVLKQSHQSKTGYKYMISHIDEKLFKGLALKTEPSELDWLKVYDMTHS